MTHNKRHHSSTKWALLMLCLSFLCALSAFAQNNNNGGKNATDYGNLSLSVDSARKASDLPAANDPDINRGESWSGFEVKQSAEFGGRITDFTGNVGTWDTFVNLGTGPRLMEYTLDMRSPNHTGLLFDDFNFSNFGYGGDPNNVSRLKFGKGSAYTFNATFRRDQNIFDYNLLANPLNPPTSNPNYPVLDSPHEFLLTRRMSDVNLNIFPVGKVRFKLGWSRVVNEGNSYSSVHEGTEALLLQPTLNTTDNYTFGVSFRFIPKTSINYDQFYTYFKGDTSATLAGTPFLLPGSIPVDLGLPFNTSANQPCGTPIQGGLANPQCNGFLGYSRIGNVRNSYPTEQLSFQSNYFKRVDLSGRFGYTDADSDNPNYLETFDGLITRNRQRQYAQAGSSSAKRITMNADFGTTIQLTDRLRLVDNFRFDNFRIPTGWTYATASLFGATLTTQPNVFNPATCPPPFTAATCPQHINGSPADLVVDNVNQFVRQESKINTVELEYDFTRRVSAHLGYRFERREITANDSDIQLLTFFPTLAKRGACATGVVDPATGICTTSTQDTGSDFTEINGHSALFGFAARPTDKLRVSLDTEFFYADNAFTRISPRHMQRYKARASYKVTPWWNFGTAINIRENRNTAADIGNLQHNRSYAFTSTIAPVEANWGLDLSYDYSDIFSQTNICFVSTATLPGALACPTTATFLTAPSVYNEQAHFAAGSFYFKPVRRVTAGLGYTVTSSNGNTLILNPMAPTGPLSSNYHLPTGSLAIELSKNLIYKTGWNYYDYNEKSSSGPTLPRDFRGNVFTMSLRYTM
jgi:hypothetical protein